MLFPTVCRPLSFSVLVEKFGNRIGTCAFGSRVHIPFICIYVNWLNVCMVCRTCVCDDLFRLWLLKPWLVVAPEAPHCPHIPVVKVTLHPRGLHPKFWGSQSHRDSVGVAPTGSSSQGARRFLGQSHNHRKAVPSAGSSHSPWL